jgi:hypothetical protein
VSDTPLVSFLIAAFNEERFVVACVASCLDQTYTPVEVCVTDDGSTDGTWDILQAAFGQDPRVKLARLEENKGKVHAFNRSFEMANEPLTKAPVGTSDEYGRHGFGCHCFGCHSVGWRLGRSSNSPPKFGQHCPISTVQGAQKVHS